MLCQASFPKEKRSRSPFYCERTPWHGHLGHVPRGTRSVPRSRAARTFRPCIARPQAEQNGPRPSFKRRRGTQSSMAYQGRTIIQAPPAQATPISRQFSNADSHGMNPSRRVSGPPPGRQAIKDRDDFAGRSAPLSTMKAELRWWFLGRFEHLTQDEKKLFDLLVNLMSQFVISSSRTLQRSARTRSPPESDPRFGTPPGSARVSERHRVSPNPHPTRPSDHESHRCTVGFARRE
jgi:hypothetical protein